MTDRELKKLSRAELLEMLLMQTEEVERLQKELQSTRAMLKDQRLYLTEAGNIAEAALRMNRVFETAQAAADQYLDNIAVMERRTQEQCREMIRRAEAEVDSFWDAVRSRLEELRREPRLLDELAQVPDRYIGNRSQDEMT